MFVAIGAGKSLCEIVLSGSLQILQMSMMRFSISVSSASKGT